MKFAALKCSQPKKMLVVASRGAAAKMSSMRIESTMKNSAKMPSAKPKSPTRLTTKALIAAALADGFLK